MSIGGVYTSTCFKFILFTEGINSNILDIRVREKNKIGEKIKMQKTAAKIITTLLLTALTLTLIPLAFASSGNILINDTTMPQDLPITPVPAGGNVTLFFGDVSFSGSQFYLLLSQDGLSQVSSGDIRYTPLFNVADVMATATITQVPGSTLFPGGWTIGQGWVNGSTPLNVAGGTFYIKAFDGAVAALAVTQGFPVSASITVAPTTGAGGTQLTISGNAFPANALVNLTYLNPVTGAHVLINNLTQAGSLGEFTYPFLAPDILGLTVNVAGDNVPPASNVIQFEATENATAAFYTANYLEMQRGLLQIGEPNPPGPAPGSLQNATGVYGNLTRFDLTPTIPGTTISVGVGKSLRIVGNWFFPGAVTLRWDNAIDVTPSGTTANQTGYFNTTLTVPATGVGSHNVTIIDSGVVTFVVFVNVVPSITVSPTSGPIGTVVTVEGFGFPASAGTTVYNATVTFSGFTSDRNGSLTDAAGHFILTFAVPAGSAGGVHTITATANQTGFVPVTATFRVTASFTVSPSEFYANSTAAVVASGSGFDTGQRYYFAIDNLFTPGADTQNGTLPGQSGSNLGKLSYTFVQAGFQPGLHVVSVYQLGGNNAPAANATFTVLADPLTSTSGALDAINETVTNIWNKTQVMNTEILAINNTVVTILTNTGVIQTSLDAINATVIAINGNVATLATAVGTLTTNVANLNATVVAINGNVATIKTDVGTIKTTVANINGNLTSVSGGFATVQTTVGQIKTSVDSISATLSSVSGTVGTISSSVGDLSTDLSAINTKVTSIQGTVATIQTDLGTLSGTVTTISNGVATIQTNIGTLQTDVSGLQTSVNNVPGQVTIPIWIAVVLALIAAIAAIASLLLVRRKIAG